jgi:hypothetical protein
VDVGAVATLAALLAMAVTVAWVARRLEHEVGATATAVDRLRRVRSVLDRLHAEAAATGTAVDDTGQGLSARPPPRR